MSKGFTMAGCDAWPMGRAPAGGDVLVGLVGLAVGKDGEEKRWMERLVCAELEGTQ
jgi:hypothetical protein